MTDIDLKILDGIQNIFGSGFLDAVMPVITHLGTIGAVWIVISLILIFTKKYRKCGMDMLVGMLIGLIIGNLMIKNIAARDRPCWINESFDMLVAVPKDYSFPSGHTLSSAISAAVLLRYDRRLGIPALILAVLIAFSRMYLYVHFPSDILAGALLGVTIGVFTPMFTQKALVKLKKVRNKK